MSIPKLKHFYRWLLPQSDVPFEREEAHRALPWIILIMTLLSGLILAAGLSFNRFAVTTIAQYGRLYQIQIPYADGKEEGKADAIAAELAKASDGFRRIHRMTLEEVGELLKPWLGDARQLSILPVPQVIELEVATGEAQRIGLAAIDTIKSHYPEVAIDRYDQAAQQFSRAARTVQWMTYGLGLLIILAAITVIVLMTRASVQLHFPIVRLLHRIGAHDGYISRQFQKNATLQTLKGSVPGALISAGIFFVCQHFLTRYDLLASVNPWQDRDLMLMFLLLPVLLTLIVATTTYGAVRQMLYKVY